jgi:hypothetical protein
MAGERHLFAFRRPCLTEELPGLHEMECTIDSLVDGPR